MLEPTPLYGGNAEFLDALYEDYLTDPARVPEGWRRYFAQLMPAGGERAHGPLRAAIAQRAAAAAASGALPGSVASSARQAAVSRLIQVWINRGHLLANIDPLGLMPRPRPQVLDLEYFGLSAADLDTEFFTGSRTAAVPARLPLRDILAQLQFIYAGTVGAEFAHMSDSEERLWLQDEFQEGRLRHRFSAEERRNILWQLTAAEGLERYLHTRYVGQKRFSLEGEDALIPLLDDLIQRAGDVGMEEVVIGMAHRGRLNVLVNLLGKSPAELFSEFEGAYDPNRIKGSGDVKYHKGFSADLRTAHGNVHTVLAFNPSHLEVVDPVVEGSVRARQERRGDERAERVLPLLLHGDASFTGQGVVMETLQLSQARGFFTGGTVHVIINNQVGFTTSAPADARSTMYCSDVAKMLEVPIFHVNADDPEAVVFVTRLALKYRMRFHKDVVIDLVGYRRHGHNEAAEPAATQPLMYRIIREHPTARRPRHDRQQVHGRLERLRAGRLDRARVDRRRAGAPARARRAYYHSAAGLHAAPARGAAHGQPPQDGAGGVAARLGLRRDARLRGASRGRFRGAYLRPGQRPRHVLSPPRGAARPAVRRHLDSAAARRGDAAARADRRFAAVGRGGARLRIRLLDHRARLAGGVGGSVRRFRQRRPGDHRPVHQLGRSEVGALLRDRAVPAARLRGSRTRAFLGAPRALPATVRREQHAGVRALHAGADVPHAAPSDAATVSQAADRDDPEEPAASRAAGVGARGADARRCCARHRRDRRAAAAGGAPRGVLQRQGVLRPAEGAA